MRVAVAWACGALWRAYALAVWVTEVVLVPLYHSLVAPGVKSLFCDYFVPFWTAVLHVLLDACKRLCGLAARGLGVAGPLGYRWVWTPAVAVYADQLAPLLASYIFPHYTTHLSPLVSRVYIGVLRAYEAYGEEVVEEYVMPVVDFIARKLTVVA
jgi:hypothetical protein